MNPSFRRFLLFSLLPATLALGFVEWRINRHPDPKKRIEGQAPTSPKMTRRPGEF